MKSLHHGRAIDRYNYARNIGDQELLTMLSDELKNKKADSKNVVMRKLLSMFGGDDTGKLPVSGYEMKRLLRRIGVEPPEFYKDRELFLVPIEKIEPLLSKVGKQLEKDTKS